MTTMTKRDAVDAAMSVAQQIAEGRLDPATLQQQAVAECRALAGEVSGPDSPLWSLQVDIARQVLSLGGIPATELAEWAAVFRRRAPEASEPPVPHDDPLPAVSSLSVAPSHDSGDAEADVSDDEPEPAALQGTSIVSALAALASAAQQAHAEPAPQRRADGDGYDPLRGFNPGATRRR
ncbi:hypothetical protein [Mycolicibacterium monacense]|uniref:Flagellar hook-length control protein n=1 Tax=Mycolicibacterium monacense TaxID=85693 RepID=A0AAD1N251_MYCMB|nr:hypothetical protein [Mycolicibacterium monacense]ORB20490.1 hypothetical protein BST34_12025 [Mycolicibacterium monacense DSM 44395]QHP88114.1 flagellar hook-length control protein [Mycolicibacterium monacense DSM 44395]BBZ64509.1 hypothetical protein MMON_58100 [Mycolicibacterium monacense]